MEKREAKKALPAFLFLWGMLLSWTGPAHASPFFESYVSRFFGQAGSVAVDVVSLPSGQVVWERGAREPLVPASLVKLLTSHAALKSLGSLHRFETRVFTLHNPRGGILPGDIWVKSEGDLHFTDEKARDLAHRLRTAGITRIEGSVVVDNRYFDPPTQQICVDERCSRSYNPVISGTALDYNTLTFRVTPAGRAGASNLVTWSPMGDYVRVTNESRTIKGRPKQPLQLHSTGVGQDGREHFRLRGEMPLGSRDPWEVCLNVKNPPAFFGYSFRELLREAGVEVRGGVREGATPAQAFRVVTHESDPLGELLHGLNRFSNNFMAEMLLRSLGAGVYGEPGTQEKGIRAIETHLLGLGIPPAEFSLASGSGLSRDCRASPRIFSKILLDIYRDVQNGPRFIASLAVNGEEGTLRRRLKDSEVTLRGKTGSLKDVVAFSGYVSAPGRGLFAATVLLNDVQNTAEARETLYRFLEELPYAVPVQSSRRQTGRLP